MKRSIESINKKIISNPSIKAVLGITDGLYVVGGYLRELLLSGRQADDIDFIVTGDPAIIARKASHELGGTVVELREECVTRIALRNGGTLDFSRMTGGSIFDDLKSRDFTVNAVAWSPVDGIIDPLGGIGDIERGLISAIDYDNLLNDPLRLLRAYRFGAEYDWIIDDKTRGYVRKLADRIKYPASERITLEMIKLLNGKYPARPLKEAFDDRLLGNIISIKNKGLSSNIKLISNINTKLNKIPLTYNFRFASQGLTFGGLIRLEILMMGADLDNSRFSFSRDTAERIGSVNDLHSSFKSVRITNKSKLFDLLQGAGKAALDLIVLTKDAKDYKVVNLYEGIIKKRLVSSGEIMEITGIKPGKILGCILNDINRMRFAGSIKTKRDALSWIKKQNINVMPQHDSRTY